MILIILSLIITTQVVWSQNSDPVLEIGTRDFTLDFKIESARYIKVFANWIGPCPDWSPCAGLGNAYMFVDEIIVE